MDQDTLRIVLREAVRETVDRGSADGSGAGPDGLPAGARGPQERLLPPQAGDHLRPGGPEGP